MDFVNSILEIHLGSKVYHPNSTKFSSDESKNFETKCTYFSQKGEGETTSSSQLVLKQERNPSKLLTHHLEKMKYGFHEENTFRRQPYVVNSKMTSLLNLFCADLQSKKNQFACSLVNCVLMSVQFVEVLEVDFLQKAKNAQGSAPPRNHISFPPLCT